MQTYRQALPKGYMLHEYQVDRVLGAGGFGLTYLGWDTSLDKAVAIKEYLPNDFAVRESDHSVLPKSSGDEQAFRWGLERFLDEARTLARFRHPNVIAVHRYFEANNSAYIVMEYAEGETLGDLLERRGVLEEALLLRILLPLSDGLAEVHGVGFLHRDIKPGNIVIRADGSPVLVDFGTARQALGSRSRSITSVVTPGYAPIEQYSTHGRQGAWTDIYALGAVAYRAVCGEAPLDATERVLEDRMRSAQEAGVGRCSGAVLRAIDWALSVEGSSRPQTVSAWREVLTGEGEAAHPDNGADEASAASAEPKADESAAGWKQSRKGRSGVATGWKIVAAFVGIVVVYTAYDDHREKGEGRQPAEEMRKVPRLTVGEVFRDCPHCPRMKVIPAGSYSMGSPSNEAERHDDEGPVRLVTIAKPFAVGVHEVTVGEYSRFVAATRHPDGDCVGGASWRDPGFPQSKAHPVVCVNWDDAQAYVAWLRKETRRSYRLLSESEWEYMARAGTTTSRYWGDSASGQCRYANGADGNAERYGYGEAVADCDDGYYRTAPAGSYRANGYGIHDALGNVWEWVQDCWNDSYRGAPTDGGAWESGDCGKRVLRGGSWYYWPGFLRSAVRVGGDSGYRSLNGGFRVARMIIP